jgi:hypothetical protein
MDSGQPLCGFRNDCAAFFSRLSERMLFRVNRDAFQIVAFARFLFGKLVSTFPGHALERQPEHH